MPDRKEQLRRQILYGISVWGPPVISGIAGGVIGTILVRILAGGL